MKKRRSFALLLVLVLTISCFSGCGNKTTENTGSKDVATESTTNTDTNSDSDTTAGVTLPLTDEPVTLTYFIGSNATLANLGYSYETHPVILELEKRTGIHIEFQCPAAGEEATSYNLMIASGELTDLINNGLGYSYPDGQDAAVEDGYYLDLTPYMDTYLSDYAKLRTKDDFFAKSTITDAGRIVGVYQIFTEPQGPWSGLQVRKDWLDDLGLETPVTYDDWEVMLTKFKEEKGVYAPLSLGSLGYNIMTHSMSAGFGAICDFMNVDGTVVYGPIQDGWREYLSLMNDWYAKGLINPDYMTGATFTPDMGMVTTGQIGAWDSIYTLAALYEMSSTDGMEVIPVTSPVVNEGDELHIRLQDSILGVYVSVAADTEYPELCAKWLNYLTTKEGSDLLNYGVEGQGLRYDENGNATFTELVTQNPDGLSFSQAISVYAMPPTTMGCHYDWTRELLAVPAKDLASFDVWGAASDDYIMPAGLTHTGDESQELASLITDITTYVDECTNQFITGVKDPETDWDEYVANIEKMNIQRAVEIKQAALERFNAR